MRWMALSLAAVVILAAGCGGGGHKSCHHDDHAAAAATKAAATVKAKANAAAAGLSGLATTANCRQLADLSAEFSSALQGTELEGRQEDGALS